jgi:hypothetical protein
MSYERLHGSKASAPEPCRCVSLGKVHPPDLRSIHPALTARATGIARSTIGRGLRELAPGPAMDRRVRRSGGGRKKLSDTDATLAQDLLRLVEPATLGDPMRPLLWVSKSLEKLAVALRGMGHRVSANTVRRLLRTLGFSRQGNVKANEGRGHPDRDAQFEHINAQVLAFQADEQPVIRWIPRRRSGSATSRLLLPIPSKR